MSTLLEQIRALPVDEQMALAGDALESSGEGNDSPGLAPSLQVELERRIDEHLAHPGRAATLEAARQRNNESVESRAA
ncbi:MAG TPA: hypothetical protein DIT13_11355 [Verrucomicrobiales bacterium]|nr:hypothetical protein [Verrucomicrobiales bacterium]HRJ08797.1 hypothetical protein [Prosthecobacter sp.]HRK13317.1 hypothetical protein [Prosthecobacter sp.]